ncbi:dihydrodipicolinate synthase family protein [Novosphingobium colocasiae]|uniref:dihydrodipicolinate synthase family protein n=1 Tax=Novosphingobium colocasiae TaxID=1256513 RepID=UPI0035AED8D6
MKRSKHDAKNWGNERVRGVFGAAPVPYFADGQVDEQGFRSNLRYWRDTLGIKGQWVAGFQSEQLGISTAQRKQLFEITQSESTPDHIAICAIMDDVIEDALELAIFADEMGADCIGLSAPRIFTGMLGADPSEDTVFRYFEYICDRVEIPVILLNQKAMQGYNMSPALLNRLADLPNVVALKNVVDGLYGGGNEDGSHYRETVRLCGEKIVVSDPDEDVFFRNYTQNGQRAFLSSGAPMIYQTAAWQPMNEYTRLADLGRLEEAAKVNLSLNPVREAFHCSMVHLGRYKFTPLSKYWFELQGLVGGLSVYPQDELTEEDKAYVREQFERSGIASMTNEKALAA